MIAPDPLGLVWARADASEARITADEVALWPEGHEQILTGGGLISRAENATTVICDACPDAHVEEVTLIKSPEQSDVRAYIQCPQAGRVRVPLERLKEWKVDYTGIAGAVAHALELAGAVDEIIAGRVWSLGKATVAGRSRECFLARGLTWTDARSVISSCARLNAAGSPIVFVAGEVPCDEIWSGDAIPVVALGRIVTWNGSGLSIDRQLLEGIVSTGRRKAPVVPLVSFPALAGTTWGEVRFIVTDATMRIDAKGKRKVYTLSEAGFEDRRQKNTPDRLWVLLRTFAEHGGVLPTGVVQGKDRANLKQDVSDLRQRVSALVPGIDGDPIAYEKTGQCYRTAFKIASDEVPQFPTPAGASWTDVSIRIEGPTTVRVSMPSTERFSTRSYTEDEARGGNVPQQEVGERPGTIARAYELRALKLADDANKPNRAGEALLAVVTGNGVVSRKADDKGMLELGGVLTKLTGIDGSPFEFASFEKKWVAVFEVQGKPTAPR